MIEEHVRISNFTESAILHRYKAKRSVRMVRKALHIFRKVSRFAIVLIIVVTFHSSFFLYQIERGVLIDVEHTVIIVISYWLEDFNCVRVIFRHFCVEFFDVPLIRVMLFQIQMQLCFIRVLFCELAPNSFGFLSWFYEQFPVILIGYLEIDKTVRIFIYNSLILVSSFDWKLNSIKNNLLFYWEHYRKKLSLF